LPQCTFDYNYPLTGAVTKVSDVAATPEVSAGEKAAFDLSVRLEKSEIDYLE
jgi:hypothetical protein